MHSSLEKTGGNIDVKNKATDVESALKKIRNIFAVKKSVKNSFAEKSSC